GPSLLHDCYEASSGARSVIASIIAIKNGHAEEPPVLVPSTYNVPLFNKKSSIFNVSSNVVGVRTFRTSGTDSPLTAPSTPNHFDCNNFGSLSIMPCSTRFQLLAAAG